jgi:hypothetical protein
LRCPILPDQIHQFGFVSGYTKRMHHGDDPVNIAVAENLVTWRTDNQAAGNTISTIFCLSPVAGVRRAKPRVCYDRSRRCSPRAFCVLSVSLFVFKAEDGTRCAWRPSLRNLVPVQSERVHLHSRPPRTVSSYARLGEGWRIVHQNYSLRMEGNIVATLREQIVQIGHIQAADVPHRHQSGTGEFHYRYIFASLAELPYSGSISLEYVPLGTSEGSFAWLPPDRRGAIDVHALRL